MGGGGDGYRSVAYFVNVSAHSQKKFCNLTNFGSGLSIEQLEKSDSRRDADCAQGYLWKKP